MTGDVTGAGGTYARGDVGNVPRVPGAYELLYGGCPVYVGHTLDLRRRVGEHARVNVFHEVRVHVTGTLDEAMQERDRLVREWRPGRPDRRSGNNG